MRRRLALLLPLVALTFALPGVAGAAPPTDDAPPTTTTPGAPPPPTTTTPAPPAPAPVATVPDGTPLYADGQDGRVVMNGPWLFRLDPQNVGVAQRFFAQGSTAGWSPTSVPSAWNAGDDSTASFLGSVAWYRKDFRLPSRAKALDWIVRFESANFRATVWLNGRQLGGHVGGYLPFELDLAGLHRSGVNRLVVRVDNRRAPGDPQGAGGDRPQPPGGWWNYGGLLREVYLRRVDRVDIGSVQVEPSLSCATCSALVTTLATVRNVTAAPLHVHLSGRFGRARLDFGVQLLGAGQTATFTARLRVAHPQLWSPSSPHLYGERLSAVVAPVVRKGRAPKAVRVAGYSLHTGIRSLTVTRGGQLLLNGQVVHFRGVALHEDTATAGAAMDNATRARLVALAHDAGATLIRSHYPLHPEFQELADRTGLLLWSEVPAMYQVPDADLGRASFRDLAFQELRANIAANSSHPSVAIWSIGNEMPATVGPNQARYIAGATALVRQLDPTRPVALAFAGHPEAGCQTAYAPLDMLGMNDYFGWYTGADGDIADRDLLSPFLDQLRACYPAKALAVTEFGAEANRDGPVEEKGTYAFQSDFVQYHLNVFASKPWLTGAVYWALQEFRVRPGWGGGNPWGTPPIHTKGLVRLDWSEKPAFAVLQAGYRAVAQFVAR
jgi:beta-glucuronidase